jgi:hypothetical protein
MSEQCPILGLASKAFEMAHQLTGSMILNGLIPDPEK